MDKIKQVAAEHIAAFMEQHRAAWPHWVIITGIFAAGLIVAGMWFSVTHPAAGEIWQNQLISLLLLFVSIAAAFLGFAIARGIYLSAPELTRDMPPALSLPEKAFLVFGIRFGDTVRTLPASTWTPPDASPDILVCNLPGEGPEQFAARMDDAIEQANVARWVVVLKRGFPAGMIFGAPDAAMEFLRDWPPFQTENWLPEQRIVPMGTRFRDETEDQFQDYIERFMEHFPEWAQRKKITGEKTRAGFVFQQVVKAASVVFFLLFSVATFAQKAEKVQATPIAGKVPPAGEKVTYIFAKAELYRTADGRKNYAELLPAAPNYRDGGGGELIAILVDGQSVYKAEQTGDVAQQPATKAATMRPHNETVNPEGLIPDSIRMQEMAGRVKVEFDRAGREVIGAARPWFDTLNFIFMWLYPVLVLVGGVCYLWAYVSAKQGMYEMHRASMRALTWVALITATVALVNALVFAFSLNLHPIGLTIIAGIEVAIIVYLTHKFIPDFRPSAGNTPRRPINPYNQPELPG